METLSKQDKQATSHHVALCVAAGLSTEDTAISVVLSKAWDSGDTAKTSSLLARKTDERELCGMVSAITTLAILSRDVLAIFVNYSASVNSLSIDVYPADTDFHRYPRPDFHTIISFKRGEPIEQLKALEDKLIELVAAAKDNAMGAI